MDNNDKPWLWKKGISANPGGRPKGSVSLKVYVRNKILSMTDEEKEEFLDSLPKAEIWKMAEGNPETKNDIKIDTNHIFTEEEIENAKQILIKRIDNRPTESSVGEIKSE